MSSWSAEITNDPEKDYDLYVELLEDDQYRGRLIRAQDGSLQLVVYSTDKNLSVPAEWLRSIIDRALAET